MMLVFWNIDFNHVLSIVPFLLILIIRVRASVHTARLKSDARTDIVTGPS